MKTSVSDRKENWKFGRTVNRTYDMRQNFAMYRDQDEFLETIVDKSDVGGFSCVHGKRK